MQAAYRHQFARNPEGVLKASRTAVKMMLDLRAAYKKKREVKLRYEMGPYETTEIDTFCAVIDLLQAAGYFDIDGGLQQLRAAEKDAEMDEDGRCVQCGLPGLHRTHSHE